MRVVVFRSFMTLHSTASHLSLSLAAVIESAFLYRPCSFLICLFTHATAIVVIVFFLLFLYLLFPMLLLTLMVTSLTLS